MTRTCPPASTVDSPESDTALSVDDQSDPGYREALRHAAGSDGEQSAACYAGGVLRVCSGPRQYEHTTPVARLQSPRAFGRSPARPGAVSLAASTRHRLAGTSEDPGISHFHALARAAALPQTPRGYSRSPGATTTDAGKHAESTRPSRSAPRNAQTFGDDLVHDFVGAAADALEAGVTEGAG